MLEKTKNSTQGHRENQKKVMVRKNEEFDTRSQKRIKKGNGQQTKGKENGHNRETQSEVGKKKQRSGQRNKTS